MSSAIFGFRRLFELPSSHLGKPICSSYASDCPRDPMDGRHCPALRKSCRPSMPVIRGFVRHPITLAEVVRIVNTPNKKR
jgi:hypothetical protein